MKKLLFLALVAILVIAMAVPAMAADGFTLVRQAKGNLYDLYLNGELVQAGVIGQNDMPGNGKSFTVKYNGATLDFVNGKDLTSSTTFASYCAQLGHPNAKPFGAAPTCTEAGWSRLYCGDCHDYVDGLTWEEAVIPALGHAYYWLHDIPYATCTQESNHWMVCTREGCDWVADYVNTLRALGHDWMEVEVVVPTCTNDGYTVYECSRCGEEKTDIIEATGHTTVVGFEVAYEVTRYYQQGGGNPPTNWRADIDVTLTFVMSDGSEVIVARAFSNVQASSGTVDKNNNMAWSAGCSSGQYRFDIILSGANEDGFVLGINTTDFRNNVTCTN